MVKATRNGIYAFAVNCLPACLPARSLTDFTDWPNDRLTDRESE
jgi:hypothetical protein